MARIGAGKVEPETVRTHTNLLGLHRLEVEWFYLLPSGASKWNGLIRLGDQNVVAQADSCSVLHHLEVEWSDSV